MGKHQKKKGETGQPALFVGPEEQQRRIQYVLNLRNKEAALLAENKVSGAAVAVSGENAPLDSGFRVPYFPSSSPLPLLVIICSSPTLYTQVHPPKPVKVVFILHRNLLQLEQEVLVVIQRWDMSNLQLRLAQEHPIPTLQS